MSDSPLRLEPAVLDFLATSAKKRGASVNQLVNRLLKNDMELIQAAGGKQRRAGALRAC